MQSAAKAPYLARFHVVKHGINELESLALAMSTNKDLQVSFFNLFFVILVFFEFLNLFVYYGTNRKIIKTSIQA